MTRLAEVSGNGIWLFAEGVRAVKVFHGNQGVGSSLSSEDLGPESRISHKHNYASGLEVHS